MRGRVATAGLAMLVVFVGAGAAATVQSSGPQPVFAAFALLKQGNLRTTQCGQYRIIRGTYSGPATSGDARLAGIVTFTARIARTARGSYGVATGQFVIRDSRRRIRMRAGLNGVLSESGTVNGLVAGRLFAPNARLLGNLTMVFDDVLRFASVRLGMESGANSAIAYPPVPKC